MHETMQAIVYYKITKNLLEYRYDLFSNILNLSKRSFSLKKVKVLNKNLNFVLSPKQYSQKQFDTDTGDFFCLLKLRSHLQKMPMTYKY